MTEPALAVRPRGANLKTELERQVDDLEARVPGMQGHARRVAVYAALTGQRLGLDRAEVARVRQAAVLHDIGDHELLTELGDEELTAIVRHHHERFDGRGHPDGLVGEQIPIGARIVAVADTFDAVTSERLYRSSLDHAAALELLEGDAGARLDPQVVAGFRVHCSGLRGVLEAVRQR